MGSLVAALASFLDARAAQGRWLIRIEDVDTVRAVPGAAQSIIDTLAMFGMHSDAAIVWQSHRGALYSKALDQLAAQGLIYGCRCTRAQLGAGAGEAIYGGYCRHLNLLDASPEALARRVTVGHSSITWNDRGKPSRIEHLAQCSGDFIVRRKDGLWSYQLAVVVDDADQGVTHVVRGDDLVESTARQCFLQERLGLPRPLYLHVPVVRDEHGHKLSKSTGAAPLLSLIDGRSDPLSRIAILDQALQHLGCPATRAPNLREFWREAINAWSRLHPAMQARPV
jgi:glutamyl-Q tRNA(Asp) synthetase